MKWQSVFFKKGDDVYEELAVDFRASNTSAVYHTKHIQL